MVVRLYDNIVFVFKDAIAKDHKDAIAKDHRLDGLNKTNLSSHSSGG